MGPLTDYTTTSGAGSNGIEVVLHTLQNSRRGTSPSDAVYYHTPDTLFSEGGGALLEIQSADRVVDLFTWIYWE